MDFEVSLAEMKAYSKYRNITLNDLFISVLSNSCYEYFQKYKAEGPDKAMVERLKCGFPFSLREPAKSLEEFKTCNDICLFMQEIRLFEKFEDALKHFKVVFKKLKSSLRPFASYYAMGFAAIMPFCVPKLLINIVSDKPSFMWTNVPGLKKRFKICGVDQTGIFVYLPNIGYLPNGISMVTSGDLIGFAVFVEETSGMQHPQELVDIYSRRIKEVVKEGL